MQGLARLQWGHAWDAWNTRDRPVNQAAAGRASMGPRLGRVEYLTGLPMPTTSLAGFNGATLRTRGIQNGHERIACFD